MDDDAVARELRRSMAAIARAHNLVDRAMRATLEARAILANLPRGADRPRENRSAEAAGEGGES